MLFYLHFSLLSLYFYSHFIIILNFILLYFYFYVHVYF